MPLIFLLLFLHFHSILSNKSFICRDGREIDIDLVCDGTKNCFDGSDETKILCQHIICPTDMYRCFYGACIIRSKKCNGIIDCADSSDESQCGKENGSCEENEFKCNSGECISTINLCDGNINCKDKSDEGELMCDNWPCPDNAYRCHLGGCINIDSQCDGFIDCIDGSDESETLCRNLKCKDKTCDDDINNIKCPPINSSRILVKCEEPTGRSKGIISCTEPVPIGTVAKYECKPYYKPAHEKHFNNTHAICQPDGTWNRDILMCEAECGKKEPDVTSLILYGWKAKKGNWPWHVVLYLLEGGNWIFSCGGTLITEKTVLTAAHCVWEIPEDDIQIALSKYESDYDKKDEYTLIFSVERIVIHPLYQDLSGNYGSDISLLIINSTILFSEFIKPICIDWKGNFFDQMTEGKLGTVVGMGLTESNTQSKEIKVTHLPIISDEKCIDYQSRDFKKYVTYTAFCAGWTNGSGVCNGDSGGGFFIPNPNDPTEWYLQGIVSVSPRKQGTSVCDPNYYTVFTKVVKYLDWLEKVLKTVHSDIYSDIDNVVF